MIATRPIGRGAVVKRRCTCNLRWHRRYKRRLWYLAQLLIWVKIDAEEAVAALDVGNTGKTRMYLRGLVLNIGGSFKRFVYGDRGVGRSGTRSYL